MLAIPLGEKVSARLTPLSSKINIGVGKGKVFETELSGGHAGIILDGRNRPLKVNDKTNVEKWYQEFGLNYE